VSYLLDTNACIALLKGDKAVVRVLRQRAQADFKLCSVVRAELLYGAHKSAKAAANLRLLADFFGRFESLPFDDTCAAHYGEIRAMLGRSGTPIGPNDLLIASIARAHSLALLTRNDDEFRRVAGLVVEAY